MTLFSVVKYILLVFACIERHEFSYHRIFFFFIENIFFEMDIVLMQPST